MSSSNKKQEKAKAKLLKKQLKAELKQKNKDVQLSTDTSPAVRFAEVVRGCLSVLTGASLAVALILGQRGTVVSLDDVVESLFAALAGKLVLTMIALGLLLYGLKLLRLIR